MKSMSIGIGAALLSAILALPLNADARSIPANAASFTEQPGDAGCFVDGGGTVTNRCSRTAHMCIPLPVDSAGYHNMTLTASAPSVDSNVGCIAVGVNPEATSLWTSAYLYLSSFPAAQSIPLNGAWVPGGGALFVCCDVKSGGRIHSANYNP